MPAHSIFFRLLIDSAVYASRFSLLTVKEKAIESARESLINLALDSDKL